MTRWTRLAVFVWAMVVGGSAMAQAPINTDVALQPREGGLIVRQQFRYSELGDDPTSLDREVDLFIARTTLVYGLKNDLTLIVTAPVVFREVRSGMTGGTTRAEGFGDPTVLAKYRLYRDDFGPLSTRRFDVIAGLEIRSGDSDFSSDSYDPIIGAVFTHAQDRHAVSTDLLWKFNTGSGAASVDRLRYDVAYLYRLLPESYGIENPTALFAVLELNGIYETNGDNELFLSPGLQVATRRFIIEATIQVPIWQDLDRRLETDFVVGVGIRLVF